MEERLTYLGSLNQQVGGWLIWDKTFPNLLLLVGDGEASRGQSERVMPVHKTNLMKDT